MTAGLAAVVIMAPASAPGQPLDLDVLNRGKPQPRVEVSAFLNAGKVPVGTTDEDGRVSIDRDAVDIADGERVDVWVKRCEEGRVREVILAPRDEVGFCEEAEGEQDERCGCEGIGAFPWGGDEPVTIDIGTGEVVRGSPASGKPRVTWGVALNNLFFSRWDVACDRVECDDGTYGWSAEGFVRYRFPDRSIGVGGAIHGGSAPDVETHRAGFDTSVTTDFLGLAPYGIYFWRWGGIEGVAIAGAEYLHNYVEIVATSPNGMASETFDRDEGNWNGVLGADLHLPISDRWRILLGARFSGFNGHDADSGIWSIRIGVLDP